MGLPVVSKADKRVEGARCLVTAAFGGPGHHRGQDRLLKSLDEIGYCGHKHVWRDETPPGCPTHNEVPYAFKTHMLSFAASRGSNVLLWCDASVWFVKTPDLVFDRIEKQGYYVAEVVSKHRLGTWCSDSALHAVGFSRDEAMDITLVYGGFYGYNLDTDIGVALASLMMKHVLNGALIGDWNNDRGQVSSDARCRGHRHDQSILSAVAFRLGIEADRSPGMFMVDSYESRTEKTVAVCRGMA